MENNTKKHSLKISSTSKSKKPKILANFDKYFNDNVEKENIADPPTEKQSPKNIIHVKDSFPDEEKSSLTCSIDHNQNQNAKNVLPNEDLMQLAVDMFAIAQVVTKQLKIACETVHTFRTKSSLGICRGDIAERDVPWLTLFHRFNMPLKSKEEVEALEQELEKSSDFLKFFICRIVPIVKNLYQSQKSILEGFICSLMSKEVIVLFRWSGRIENSAAFKELKNIQIVLLSAMVRVDPKYTLYQFENDVKAVLTKCVQVSKKGQKNKSEYGTKDVNGEQHNDSERITAIEKDGDVEERFFETGNGHNN